jgi:hypothetical protein
MLITSRDAAGFVSSVVILDETIGYTGSNNISLAQGSTT